MTHVPRSCPIPVMITPFRHDNSFDHSVSSTAVLATVPLCDHVSSTAPRNVVPLHASFPSTVPSSVVPSRARVPSTVLSSVVPSRAGVPPTVLSSVVPSRAGVPSTVLCSVVPSHASFTSTAPRSVVPASEIVPSTAPRSVVTSCDRVPSTALSSVVPSSPSVQTPLPDMSLCVQSFPQCDIGHELRAVLSDLQLMEGHDQTPASSFFPPSTNGSEAERLACLWDGLDSGSSSPVTQTACAVLGPSTKPFHIGNRTTSIDINEFHVRNGHLCELLLKETARQQGLVLTGKMEPCDFCLTAKGRQANVAKQGGRGRAALPNQKVYIDFCGPYTPTIGGNQYNLFLVDSASRFAKNYAVRRKSDGLAAFKRGVIEFSRMAGRPIECVQCDIDAVFSSREFMDFCTSAGIHLQFSPPGVPQYNGVVESAIWRAHKAGKAARRYAEAQLGPGGFSNIPGLDPRGDKLWAESARWAVEAFNQSGTTANEGRRSPQEVFLGKKGPFRMLPFFQRGRMRVRQPTKLDDQADVCFYLNGGDNHSDSCVKVLKESTGRVSYTSNIA